jgi:hypothetical protein
MQNRMAMMAEINATPPTTPPTAGAWDTDEEMLGQLGGGRGLLCTRRGELGL